MSPATTPALKLNNGVEMPGPRPGRLPEPARRDARRRRAPRCDVGYRHIDTAAAYGNEREVGEAVRASGLDRSEVFLETKIWISDYGYDETLHGFEKSAGKLGVDQIDLLILHQALPRRLRPDAGGLPRAGDAARRRQGPRDRRQQLHGRAPHPAARPRLGRPGGQSDRGAPLLRPARGPGLRRPARHPHAGLVTDRRDHLLPRRRAHQHPPGPRDRRDRPGARQEPRPGHAPLGPAARTVGHPEVHQARAHRRELRRLRLRALRRPDDRDRRSGHRPPRRAGARGHHARGLRPRRSPRPDPWSTARSDAPASRSRSSASAR